MVRKIWNYGAILDPSEKYLKTELITSRFRIADTIQLDIHAGIASYLSKYPMIYKHIDLFNKADVHGLVEVVEPTTTNYMTYYMFLLDYKNINANSEIDEKCDENM